MSIDFFTRHRGQRTSQAWPLSISDNPEEKDDPPQVLHDVEYPLEEWKPIPVQADNRFRDEMPRRFIDGCHVGETVSWLRDAKGNPVPVMLAEIGGVAVSISDNKQLRRSFEMVERVLTFLPDPFPWHEVESFARDLKRELGYRLLTANMPLEGLGPGFPFERLRQLTENRSRSEMKELEVFALMQELEIPSVIDGRLEKRVMIPSDAPLIGVIKTHQGNYLDDRCWPTYYDLAPGERTPVFRIETHYLPVISWFLKFGGPRGRSPQEGTVRVEVSASYFERLSHDFRLVDALSHNLLQLRCKKGSYTRAAISLEPIVRAEQTLRALFSPPGLLQSKFYQVTGL